MPLFRFRRLRDRTSETAAKTGAVFNRVVGGIFSKGELDEEFWESLEEALIVADVSMDTTVRLVGRVRDRARSEGAREPIAVRDILRDEVTDGLRSVDSAAEPLPDDQPTVVLVAGVNGVGKTTSIAKLAKAAKNEGRTVLLGAADTFRAGAIEQLREWGDRLDVEVIAHQAGGDPGAVAYDAMEAARARGVDLVLIDTAGRLHTKHNLMAELTKVSAIVDRQLGDYARRDLLMLDATTGQNGLLQAKAFHEAVSCDGVFLAKMDGTAKGGIILTIAGELNMPVWFIGTGETMDDLSTFDPRAFAEALISEPAGTM